LERRDRTTNREITIFSEIPGDVLWIFPGSTIFVETKRRAVIEKATNEKKVIRSYSRKKRNRDADPSNARRSPIVPTVKSAMKYIP
jgi:hypothetical protein